MNLKSSKFLSVEQLAEHLNISRSGAYQLIHQEGFPALWIGRRVVVPVDRLEAWVDIQLGVAAR